MFEQDLYHIERQAFGPELMQHCRREFDLLRLGVYAQQRIPDSLPNRHRFGDHQVAASFSSYAPLCFEALALAFQPRMEEITARRLSVTYSYARIYYHQAEMLAHTDRPSCEFSATVCVHNDPSYGSWPIWFRTPQGEDVAVSLAEGDCVIYRGDQLLHWREPYGGHQQYQAFLHYVDSQGAYRDHRWDHRPALGLPSTVKSPHQSNSA